MFDGKRCDFFSVKFVLKAEKIEEIPETSDVKEEFTWDCFPATTGQKKLCKLPISITN